ncbi:NAD(P)H-binding [Rhodoblastus acidophilus]|uniref:NAD(P)H-binding n=1 Tax=Rhodoblastus acidophilus TaxID=1074 RepID=A0A212S6S5_RHOAC|nr:NAD(P)H-binding protein [Rhodoblastus acidophilus]PPQ37250.1 hypothetical protein CKO16_14970 [Rhodoblastus acidophilus]RAI19076.1 hypothetical protein CH337_13030 [Rhodoblastus acidophilus]SNB80947.1 NAD(P)H-binding [Rhodoblastus acidophilus]
MKQKRMLIFGATGRTGAHLAVLAREAGWRVIAAARDPARVAAADEIVCCDVLSREATIAAVTQVRPGVVMSTLGGRGELTVEDLGLRHVADACLAAEVRRLIVVTSLGCGGSRRHASPRLLAAIGDVLAAKTRAEDYIIAQNLDWTLVRPGGLVESEPTGSAVLVDDETAHGLISCADLAGLLLRLASDAASVRQVYSAYDPARPTPARGT